MIRGKLIDDEHYIISGNRSWKTSSGAILNGGFEHGVDAILSQSLKLKQNIDHLSMPNFLRDSAKRLLPNKKVVGLLTLTPQKYAQFSYLDDNLIPYAVFVTVGYHNAQRPVVSASNFYDEDNDHASGSTQNIGTINIAVIVERKLTNSAMVQLQEVLILTKAQAMKNSELFPDNIYSTPTDVTLVGCLEDDDFRKTLQYGFLRTRLADTISATLYTILLNALIKQSKET